MNCKHLFTFGIALLVCLGSMPLSAQSISEKMASLKSSSSDLDKNTEQLLIHVNKETTEIQKNIRNLYDEVYQLYENDAPEEQYKALLDQINVQKDKLISLQETWREAASQSNQPDAYGLWHAPDTTLEQLIIDYGSQDYVYLIPHEIGSMKLSIDSNLPIPRASWSEMLELILTQNGVGIRTLNPYLRQLYLVKKNNSNLRMVTNNPADLEVLPLDARVGFVLSPEPAEVRRVYMFLERFINPETTVLQVLGRDILLIGPVADLLDLLKLNDFISCNRGEKEYRLVPVFKVKADEMGRILAAVFDLSMEGRSSLPPPPPPPPPRPTSSHPPGSTPPPSPPPFSAQGGPDTNGLKIIPLQHMTQALFIIGTKEEVRKAEEVIRDVESQVGGARDKSVFWYTVKHSDPEELAEVLSRIYTLMITTGTGMERPPGPDGAPQSVTVVENNAGPVLPPPAQLQPPNTLYGEEGFYQEGGFIVNPAPAQPGIIPERIPNQDRNNFIVDVKTGSIVMVVEVDILDKMKDLLRKLDVPKRMVQIETLLFEKVLNRENNFGLNLLKFADAATQHHFSGAVFNNIFPNCKDFVPENRGVFEYFISRKKTESGFPGFDLAYRFLLSQDDIQINSCPSITTINQTPATIAINEDISINTGIFEVETAKGVSLKDAFTRAQYGITISIKPTIHLREYTDGDCIYIEDDYDYVTLETDITFDTIHGGGHPSRPDVTRRHITNQVQVVDGETVILGGLRRKTTNDGNDGIPFLGEIPGLGKLFGMTTMKDSSTEMFVFITPHIIKDPKEQLIQLRQELLCLRPGDIPYFLECLEEAHRFEKARLIQGGMSILFGRPPERYYSLDGEYDGR